MKKITFILALISCQTAFAYVSGKMLTEEKAFYCPPVINCSSENVDSCTFDSDNKKYFGKLIKTGTILISNSFKGAKTTFHSNTIDGACLYQGINLEIKPDSNLEAFYIKQPISAWIINGSNANCSASNLSLCPLKKRLGFVIHNIDLPDGVLASINDIDINKVIPANSYKSLIFDDALVGCSSTKECTIDLLSKNHVKYGSVSIDMDTMDVMQVISSDKTIEVNKIDSSNIEMKKIDRERAIYCPSQINCTSNKLCSLDSVESKYFEIRDTSILLSGDRSFPFYSAYYDDSAQGGFYCEYHGDGKIRLHTKPKSYLIPHFLHPDSQWQMKPLKNDCITSNSVSCPFKKSFGFIIDNVNISSGVFASIKGKDIRKISNHGIITNDDVSIGCSGEETCTIDLLSDRHVKYGTITVSMDNMKILKTSSSYSAYITVNKADADLYETIAIGYLSL